MSEMKPVKDTDGGANGRATIGKLPGFSENLHPSAVAESKIVVSKLDETTGPFTSGFTGMDSGKPFPNAHAGRSFKVAIR